MPTLSPGKIRFSTDQEKEEKMNDEFNINFIFGVGLALAVGSILLFSFPLIYAEEQKIKHIGIEWSETCLSLISLGDLETCGNPELIKTAYSQNALKPNYQRMFDDMAQNDKAQYQKRDILNNHIKSCIKENYCNVFEPYGSVYYWYDITQETRGYMDKVITINANMKHTNLNVVNEEVFTFDNSRALILDTNQINIRSCHVIAYTPDYYTMFRELGGLMWYLLDDCKDNAKLGLLNIPYMEELTLTVIPVDESPAWLELQRLEGLKSKYKENRLGTD